MGGECALLWGDGVIKRAPRGMGLHILSKDGRAYPGHSTFQQSPLKYSPERDSCDNIPPKIGSFFAHHLPSPIV